MNASSYRAKLTFSQHAKQFYNFPIYNPIKTSIWTSFMGGSLSCEISIVEPIHIGVEYTVMIRINYMSTSIQRLSIGENFKIGLFKNSEVGYGRITQIFN